MNKRRILALLLALVFVLSACGKTNDVKKDDGKKVEENKQEVKEEPKDEKKEATIVFWHAMNGAQEEALTALTSDFMSKNPHIKVDLQNQSSYKDLQQKITATSTSPDNLPTLTQAYPDWMFNPIKDGLVHELSDFTGKVDNYEDILEGFRKGTMIDKKVYSLPFNKSVEVLWYNEDMVKELGLKVPTSYEELVSESKKVTEAKKIPATGFDSLNNYYTTFITSKGAVYDKSFDVTGDISKEAVNYYLTGVKEGYFRIAGTDKYMSTPFGSQQICFYIGSSAGESYVKKAVDGKFTVKAAPSPAGLSIQQGTDLFIFENASEEQKAAAYEYLKFLTNKENQIKWANATGYIPVRQSAIDDEGYKSAGSLIAPILGDASKNLFSNPVISGANSAYTEAMTVMESILADPDNANVDDNLKNFKNTLEGIWE